MVVVKMELLFPTSIPSFLKSSRIQSAEQNGLTEITYKMINVANHFATVFQEFKANTAEGIDEIEHLILENVMGYDTVQTTSRYETTG